MLIPPYRILPFGAPKTADQPETVKDKGSQLSFVSISYHRKDCRLNRTAHPRSFFVKQRWALFYKQCFRALTGRG